jgi:hypothetical protein
LVRKIAPTCALCAVISLLTACGVADTPTVPSSTLVTPPAPTAVMPPAPMTGIVRGTVRLEAYFGLVRYPEGPLSGAEYLSPKVRAPARAWSRARTARTDWNCRRDRSAYTGQRRARNLATVSLVGDYADGTRSVERTEVISSNLGVLQVVPWPASPPPLRQDVREGDCAGRSYP